MAFKKVPHKEVVVPDLGNLGVLIKKPAGYLYFHKDVEGGIVVDESARLAKEEPYLAVRTDSFPSSGDMETLIKHESDRRRV